jgi:hypothetical protein
MHIAAKIRNLVTPEQEDVLWQLSEKCRLVYNVALRSGNELWYVSAGTPLTGTKTVRSASWCGSYHRIPGGRATGSSPVICDKQVWKFQDTRRKPPA